MLKCDISKAISSVSPVADQSQAVCGGCQWPYASGGSVIVWEGRSLCV